MNKRLRSITLLCWFFIVFGTVALVAGLPLSTNLTAAGRLAELKSHWYVHVSHITLIVAGAFMLYGKNWARWLLVLWIAFHLVISALHSPFMLLMHCVIFAVILYFMFRPAASEYFRGV